MASSLYLTVGLVAATLELKSKSDKSKGLLLLLKLPPKGSPAKAGLPLEEFPPPMKRSAAAVELRVATRSSIIWGGIWGTASSDRTRSSKNLGMGQLKN